MVIGGAGHIYFLVACTRLNSLYFPPPVYLSVGLLVHLSGRPWNFYFLFGILLRMVWLFYYCPYPTACNLDSCVSTLFLTFCLSDYSHYMAAVVKYYVGPCIPKSMKQDRVFMVNCFRALFWAKDAVERDLILFSMLVLAYAHPDGLMVLTHKFVLPVLPYLQHNDNCSTFNAHDQNSFICKTANTQNWNFNNTISNQLIKYFLSLWWAWISGVQGSNWTLASTSLAQG